MPGHNNSNRIIENVVLDNPPSTRLVIKTNEVLLGGNGQEGQGNCRVAVITRRIEA